MLCIPVKRLLSVAPYDGTVDSATRISDPESTVRKRWRCSDASSMPFNRFVATLSNTYAQDLDEQRILERSEVRRHKVHLSAISRTLQTSF